MSIISAEEWELTSFFEVTPTSPDSDSPWPYTEVVYEVERGDLSVRCAIAPACRDVRLIIRDVLAKSARFEEILRLPAAPVFEPEVVRTDDPPDVVIELIPPEPTEALPQGAVRPAT